MNMLESFWLANSLMGLYPELSPGGGAMPGINPWGNMRGNTVVGRRDMHDWHPWFF